MERPIMLFLFALVEIILGAYSWNYSAKLRNFLETEANIVEAKVDRLEGTPYLLLRFVFTIDGRDYEGDFLKELEETTYEDLAQVTPRSIRRDRFLTIYYDPNNPNNHTVQLPNTWHAKLAIGLGIYNLIILTWVSINVHVFKFNEKECLKRTKEGLPKFLKVIAAIIGFIIGMSAFFASPLFTTDIIEPISDFDRLCYIAPVAVVLIYSGIIIVNLPLFCGLGRVQRK